jgi:hypothetical protein
LSLRYVDGLAFSGRPRGPARIRVAPPVNGAAAGGRAPGSRLSAPGPGRALAELYDRQPGRRPQPDRGRSTPRQPGPSGPGLRCHVTHAARRARGPRRGPLRRRRRTGVCVSAGEARGDASCVPARVVLVGPSDRVGAGRGSVPLCRSRLAVCGAQHQLAMCNRPQAKQVSPNESFVPGVPCHELRKRDWFERYIYKSKSNNFFKALKLCYGFLDNNLAFQAFYFI